MLCYVMVTLLHRERSLCVQVARVTASERHSVELQRHLAVILKRRLSSEQAVSFGFV
jgi:hypothetical protein